MIANLEEMYNHLREASLRAGLLTRRDCAVRPVARDARNALVALDVDVGCGRGWGTVPESFDVPVEMSALGQAPHSASRYATASLRVVRAVWRCRSATEFVRSRARQAYAAQA